VSLRFEVSGIGSASGAECRAGGSLLMVNSQRAALRR